MQAESPYSQSRLALSLNVVVKTVLGNLNSIIPTPIFPRKHAVNLHFTPSLTSTVAIDHYLPSHSQVPLSPPPHQLRKTRNTPVCPASASLQRAIHDLARVQHTRTFPQNADKTALAATPASPTLARRFPRNRLPKSEARLR